jgi:ADP-ribose pyrophosphatase
MSKWKTLETQTIFKNQWFDIKENKVQVSDELAVEGIVVLNFRDWVNVVPLDGKGRILLEKNYRHGLNSIMIETPSGSVEPEDKSVSEAARRELYEETGYAAGKMISLGKSAANAQLQNNWIHHFLALDCQLVSQPKPEIDGVIEFWAESLENVMDRVQKGEITNSYIVEGLLRAYIYLQK